MKKVMITGSSGMVGRGVLLECLESSEIEKVLVINRSAIGLQHPKLEERLLSDFLLIETLKEHLKNYDACFFCMGVSAAGLREEAYTAITYSVASKFADLLYQLNPAITFIYVSGMGTDSSEKGRSMWARVKGKTENMIFSKGFKDAYAFRPGIILPEKGIRSKTGWYNAFYVVLRPFFPLLRKSKNVTTTTHVGKAMINILKAGYPKKTVENSDINELAAK